MEALREKLRRDIINSNGHKVAENVPVNHTQCPTCGKVYRLSKPSCKEGEAWEREQHFTGYCSDACWPLGMGK